MNTITVVIDRLLSEAPKRSYVKVYPGTTADEESIAEWEQENGYRLPNDYREYLKRVGASKLHGDYDVDHSYNMQLFSLDQIAPYGQLVYGKEFPFMPRSWYAIADTNDGNYTVIDLATVDGSEARIIDGFHETDNEQELIALSFKEFLERSLADPEASSGGGGGRWYWSRPGTFYGQVLIFSESSLATTLHEIDFRIFHKCKLYVEDTEKAALWIASRLGLPGGYEGTFAPTEKDWRNPDLCVYTGEKFRSHASMQHVLAEESCRALIVLGAKHPVARKALATATDRLLDRLRRECEKRGNGWGAYCCPMCTCSLWRHLAAGGLSEAEERLAAGMEYLKGRRDGNGRWRGFPFCYTLLALSEIKSPAATEELKYARPACERQLKRTPFSHLFWFSRSGLLHKVLEEFA